MRTLALVVVASAVLVVARSAATADGLHGTLALVRATGAQTDVHAVRADGRGLRRLTRGGSSRDPAWSPDGRRIAYVSSAGGDAELYVADADGGNPRRLTENRHEDVLPSWSPDGRRLAFASDRTGAFEIWIVDADGARATRLTRGARRAYFNVFPAWSPDGRWIAFASSSSTPENQEIYVVRLDGTGRTRLTRTHGSADRLGDDATPSWSPDGRRIVFASNRTGDLQIWVMGADGRGQRLLSGLEGRDDDRPTFSPDGRWIAFGSLGPSGQSGVYVVRADGTGRRRVTSGSAPAWRP